MTTPSRRATEDAMGPDRLPSTRCQFTLVPPRHFLYPAILLLLAEKPRHGYRLIDPLTALGFGPVERPQVYRALAELEGDGLVRSWLEPPTAGSARHVYALTADGQQALEAWMSVIAQERACLDLVLEKYWYCNARRLAVVETTSGEAVVQPGPDTSDESVNGSGHSYEVAPVTERHRFDVIDDRSAVVIEARSSIGPIAFGTSGVRGWLDVELFDGLVAVDSSPTAWLEVSLEELSSGNALYDAELLSRADARRFPTAVVNLHHLSRMGDGNRYQLEGDVTFHGMTRRLGGAVTAALLDERTMIVTGEQVFDVRDFDMSLPTMPLLKIYPDVRVHLHVEAGLAI
jgi:DNA-binding PadR family transcriptional regulator/polyisoprenoid-binding protein YceI